MADNKTEKATPRRREKMRKKGRVVRSREVSSGIATMAVILFLHWGNTGWVQQWRDLMDRLLKAASQTDIQVSSSIVSWTGMVALKWAAPACLVALAASVTVQFAQGGFVFSPETMTPNFSKMSPVQNVKQLFSAAGMSRMLKTLLPLAAIIYLGFITVSAQWHSILNASAAGIATLPALLMSHAFEIAWKGAFVLMVWSVADYALQRMKYESDMKMSKQEIRDEGREDGNPANKGRIRRLQRQMRKRRMIKDVEKATVIITNPTHFAIALRYDMETMDAPIVVAKGRDLLAQKIKQIAQWHGIPAVENRPLAQALYRAVDGGSVIPSKLYSAVAEILAFVFRAQAQAQQTSGGRA